MCVEVRLRPSPLGIVVVHERMEAPIVARLQKVAELVDDDALQAGVGAKAQFMVDRDSCRPHVARAPTASHPADAQLSVTNPHGTFKAREEGLVG